MNSSDPKPSTEPSGLGKVLRAIVRTILTLILVVFIIAAVILGGYYGVVYVHNEAVIPAQMARANLVVLSTSQAQANLGLSQLSERLNALEANSTQDVTKIDSLNNSVSELQTAIQKQDQTLSRLNDLESGLNSLTQQMNASSSNNSDLQSTLAANDQSFQDLQMQVKLLQAMELLNRSRLYLLQSNFGLASSDVDGARQILEALQPILPSYQQEAVGLWIQRLNLAISNLPAYPILAGDDLEVAWGMLAGGLPQAPTGTPTPYLISPTVITSTPYLMPGLAADITPSFTPYVTPSHTPNVTPTPTRTSTKTPFVTGS
ncbi:MAG: hypothetical protein P4L50_27005 [Anaerolineaceae bacterium]|nr:hypothetical protein [Anaerolineaceae bacterium]